MIRKNLIKKLLIVLMVLCFFAVTSKEAYAYSYLANKTEIPVELEVSGANSICQTDNGYVWIGQYSGLTRYDSKEFVTYKEFEENGTTYNIDNVKQVLSHKNMLLISNSKALVRYENNVFHNVSLNDNTILINEMSLDDDNELVYIATNKGIFTYNIKDDSIEKVNDKQGIVDIVDIENTYFYHTAEGIFDANDNFICPETYILDIESQNNLIFIGDQSGTVKIVRVKNNNAEVLEKTYSTGSQINKFLTTDDNSLLFCACENGLYIIDLLTDKITSATNLENSQKLVDLLMDYESNLWIASYSTGVSMITNNALIDMLFDISQDDLNDYGRYTYAVDKIGDILYIAAHGEVAMYDTKTEQIIKDKVYTNGKKYNTIMYKVNEYLDSLSEAAKTKITAKLYYRDVEYYNGKVYIGAYGLGLIEYNPTTDSVVIFDKELLESRTSLESDSQLSYIRCIRAYDDFILFSTTRELVKYDGTNFTAHKFDVSNTKEYPLFLGKDNNGKIVMVINKQGLFAINDDLTGYKAVGNDPNPQDAGMLKFLYDGDDIYYNINSKLYCMTKNSSGKYETKEITVPYVKGSIVELAKVKLTDKSGITTYKYVVASQNQIYIADSIKNGFTNYKFLDSTNGLRKSLDANTSGFYDEENQLYYFQNQAGVFVYDFNFGQEKHTPLKMDINSIIVDDKEYYGNEIKLSKNTDRITFNLSVFGFRPNKGYTVYYKLDGVDKDFQTITNGNNSVSYTNLKGGKYKFHVYVMDEDNQISNKIDISLTKTKHVYEHVTFVILMVILGLALVVGAVVFYFRRKIKQSIKRQMEYKKITLESIEAIARTIDAKDVYTNGHSRRVGYYSREIAKAMNLPEKEVENIFYTALLHDIGKIGIPLKIINKPSRLDDEEFEIMKTHTTKGGKILKDISTIPGIVEGAMYHHEKYNGTGYPTGLKGEDIPLNARIICCADCFDAMATRRSYKAPCSKEYIISEFERCSGTQFDPEIAKVVIKLIEEDKFKTIIEEDSSANEVITEEEGKEGE